MPPATRLIRIRTNYLHEILDNFNLKAPGTWLKNTFLGVHKFSLWNLSPDWMGAVETTAEPQTREMFPLWVGKMLKWERSTDLLVPQQHSQWLIRQPQTTQWDRKRNKFLHFTWTEVCVVDLQSTRLLKVRKSPLFTTDKNLFFRLWAFVLDVKSFKKFSPELKRM